MAAAVGAAAGGIPPVTGWRHTQLRGGGGYPSRGVGNETAAGGKRHTHRTDSARTHTHTRTHAGTGDSGGRGRHHVRRGGGVVTGGRRGGLTGSYLLGSSLRSPMRSGPALPD